MLVGRSGCSESLRGCRIASSRRCRTRGCLTSITRLSGIDEVLDWYRQWRTRDPFGSPDLFRQRSGRTISMACPTRPFLAVGVELDLVPFDEALSVVSRFVEDHATDVGAA